MTEWGLSLMLELGLGMAALALLVPSLTLALQVFASTFPPRSQRTSAGERPKLAVLIPAHNEAGGIEATLRSVCAQLAPGDRVLVVADNCDDATAELARRAGADVVERRDSERRGKGFALDHGVRWLAQQGVPPQVVVFVDADCSLGAGSLDHLSRLAAASQRPVQSLDLMHAPAGAPRASRLAELAWLIKNHVRPMGMRALGLPCQLMGTGMAIPWSLLQRVSLATGALAEDVELGLSLARAGSPPLYCPQAGVHSFFPTQAKGARQQRSRWEQGHLAALVRQGLPLLWRGLTTRDKALAALALDVCVPPLAFLVLALLALGGVSTLAAVFLGARWPLAMVAFAFAAVLLSVVLAWRRHGRTLVSMADVMALPGYVLGKLPAYGRALIGRKQGWQRAARGSES
jgi:cellulose synthase/poly-beta-1,6-N-acetylglucosamine synthase-like glycosyltransferase